MSSFFEKKNDVALSVTMSSVTSSSVSREKEKILQYLSDIAMNDKLEMWDEHHQKELKPERCIITVQIA
jgi:hypothetical protein